MVGSAEFDLGPPIERPFTDFDSVHYRVDPPVDAHYTQPLQLLAYSHVNGFRRPELVNPPDILLTASEKLEQVALADLMPATVVSCDWNVLEAFGRDEGETILKPLNEVQSHGVTLLHWHDNNAVAAARDAVASVSAGFTRPVLLQRYFREVVTFGELRLWFIDGELLAYGRKRSVRGEPVIDMDKGDVIAPTVLNQRERDLADSVAAHLRRRRIRVAAVDAIAGFITDFNCLSPGLLVLLEDAYGIDYATTAIERLARPAVTIGFIP